MEVLDEIPVSLDAEMVLKHLHLRKESKSIEKNVQELVEIVVPIARPKAVYEVSYVDHKHESSVDIHGIMFTSRVLRVNLDEVQRAFPYVATCGRELEGITVPSEDFMRYYCLDAIKGMVMNTARNHLKTYLTKKFALGQVSSMAPGSLEDWPITQQRELFSIFGSVEDLIGVKLTESFLMLPLKSVSGIYFPTQIRFESCQLCAREACSGRRAPYDPDLVVKYGKST
ncbi:MAG: vitamin B12 dependent methionine synthase [Dehalococcoidia bacterium]|nr:vitamin B12 dependent methionine synthase [Dehalococcoidia bacterium]